MRLTAQASPCFDIVADKLRSDLVAAVLILVLVFTFCLAFNTAGNVPYFMESAQPIQMHVYVCLKQQIDLQHQHLCNAYLFLVVFCWCTGNNVIKLGESEYHLASGGSGSEEKTSAAMVRRMISEQLREVLGDSDENTYIAPVSCSSAAPTYHLPSPPIDNIGYNTLTRVVREELRRFRGVASYSQHQLQLPDVLKSSGSSSGTATERRGEGGYETIDDVISVVNERDQATAVRSDHGDVDSVPQHPPPPPPPQRHDSSPTTSPTADHALNASRRPIITHPQSGSAVASAQVAGDSVRQRRMPDDDLSVIRLLERIEQSSAELDSSFTALINVGLRRQGDWQRLARQLPICKPAKLARHIASIEARHRGDMNRQAAAALAEWRSYRRNKATLRELTDALTRCDLREEAQFLSSMSHESAI